MRIVKNEPRLYGRGVAMLWAALAALLISCDAENSPAREDKIEQTSLAVTIGANFVVDIVAEGLGPTTAMTRAPDGRILICEQGGALRVFKSGTVLSAPFLRVSTDSVGERGLLGVAVDPNFASNQYVYIYYTALSPTVHNRVSRFRASGDVAAPGSEAVIFELDNLSSASNHNGGAIHFGPDGKLYIATGDNANSANSQSLSTTLGKILRINPDGSIPSDNPFYGSTSGNARAIWSYGLRNPFTFTFQDGSGRMFINDVGEAAWEEINDGVAGANYGWPATEGVTSDPRFRSPVYAYGHGSGSSTGCSITGGAFYNPQTVQFPSSFVGKYFFADYCSAWVRVLDPATGTTSDFASAVGAIDMFVSPDGYLYYLGRTWVGRIGYAGSGQAPVIGSQPQSATVGVGQAVTFSVTASGTAPLAYRWQRGSTDIAGATGSSYTFTPTAADSGATFRVIVSNGLGSATSNAATLTVTSNRAPTVVISAPANQSLYAAGDAISYGGSASDPEDGTLPASAFTWQVTLHHDAHTHPFLGPISNVRTGAFVIPRTGHTETNIFYRVQATVRDAGGLTATSYVDVRPRLSTLSLQTSPAGLQLTLEGQPVTAPTSLSSVVGVTRTLGAPGPQSLAGKTYQFVGWSDAGAATHNINTPASNTTYTATFAETGTSGTGLRAEYYNNVDFTALAVTRTDATVDFNWGNAAPDPAVGADTFSVRWTGTVTPRYSQPYTFITQSDDGIRLWINDVQVINNWTNHASTENSGSTVTLNAGQPYSVRLEFYENGGQAVARLLWSSASQARQIIPSSQLAPGAAPPPPPPPPPPTGTGLKAEYFDNQDFTNLALTRTDPGVNFNWSAGSPASGMGIDAFSVRWTGTVIAANTQSYRFHAGGDDGVRLWINNVQVINDWSDHGYREPSSAPIALTAGQSYPIRLEFYENGGDARVSLAWSSASQTKQVIPAGQLVPAP